MSQENGREASHQRKNSYRNLLSRVESLQDKEDVGINAVKELGNILEEVDVLDGQCDISDRAKYTDETLLGSVVLSFASGMLVKCCTNPDIFRSTYDPAELASKILASIKEDNRQSNENDWLTLIEDARLIVPEVPSYNFLYGSFDPTTTPIPKPRKEIKRNAQEKVEKKKLQIVQNVEKDEEGIDETVNFLLKVLLDEYQKNCNKPISYYDFVVDSSSFSMTVENIFYSSFLMRDGKAQLNIDESGFATLQPISTRELNAFRNKGGVNSQMISSISIDDWELLSQRPGFIQRHRSER